MMMTKMTICAYNIHLPWLSYPLIPCSSLFHLFVLPTEIIFCLLKIFHLRFLLVFHRLSTNSFSVCFSEYIIISFQLLNTFTGIYFIRDFKYAFLLENNIRHLLCSTIKNVRLIYTILHTTSC